MCKDSKSSPSGTDYGCKASKEDCDKDSGGLRMCTDTAKSIDGGATPDQGIDTG